MFSHFEVLIGQSQSSHKWPFYKFFGRETAVDPEPGLTTQPCPSLEEQEQGLGVREK
jgi:hypothetical protein